MSLQDIFRKNPCELALIADVQEVAKSVYVQGLQQTLRGSGGGGRGAKGDPGNGALLGWGATVGSGPAALIRWGNGADVAFALGTFVMTAIKVSQATAVIRNLLVTRANAPGLGASNIYTVYVNGLATAITCTIAGAATTEGKDAANSVNVVQDDTIEIVCTVGAGAPIDDRTAASLELA